MVLSCLPEDSAFRKSWADAGENLRTSAVIQCISVAAYRGCEGWWTAGEVAPTLPPLFPSVPLCPLLGCSSLLLGSALVRQSWSPELAGALRLRWTEVCLEGTWANYHWFVVLQAGTRPSSGQ